MTIEIRTAEQSDLDDILALYTEAFPGEDLRGLVAALSAEPTVTSLVALRDGIAGHVMFSCCGAEDAGVLVGPVAVRPDVQKGGIGSTLIRAGLAESQSKGVQQAFVLGDPAYYARFGFAPETRVQTPYPIPAEWREAWQSKLLGAQPLPAAPLTVPPPWRDAALWSG